MNFKIGELHPNTPHLFADLAELLLLTGFNGKKTIHKNDLEAVLLRGPISHEEIDDEETETDLAKSMGLPYTEGTMGLCEDYLKKFG